MARAQGRRSKLYLQRRQLRLVLRGNSRIRETSGRGSRRTASPANGERKERRPGALRLAARRVAPRVSPFFRRMLRQARNADRTIRQRKNVDQKISPAVNRRTGSILSG